MSALYDACVYLAKEIVNIDFFSKVIDLVKIAPTTTTGSNGVVTASALGSAWSLTTSAFEAIKPFGYALVIMYLCIQMIDESTRENFSYEQFMRLIIKAIISLTLIDNIIYIFNLIMSVGNMMVGAIYTIVLADSKLSSVFALTDADATATGIVDSMTGGKKHFWNTIPVLLQLFFPWIIHYVCEIGIQLICWSRIVEIMIRCVFSPVGMSDMFSEGMRSSGIRYIKQFLGCCLTGVMIVIIVAVGQCISYGLLTNAEISWGGYMISSIIVQFTIFGMVLKSNSMAKEYFAG